MRTIKAINQQSGKTYKSDTKRNVICVLCLELN